MKSQWRREHWASFQDLKKQVLTLSAKKYLGLIPAHFFSAKHLHFEFFNILSISKQVWNYHLVNLVHLTETSLCSSNRCDPCSRCNFFFFFLCLSSPQFGKERTSWSGSEPCREFFGPQVNENKTKSEKHKNDSCSFLTPIWLRYGSPSTHPGRDYRVLVHLLVFMDVILIKKARIFQSHSIAIYPKLVI